MLWGICQHCVSLHQLQCRSFPGCSCADYQNPMLSGGSKCLVSLHQTQRCAFVAVGDCVQIAFSRYVSCSLRLAGCGLSRAAAQGGWVLHWGCTRCVSRYGCLLLPHNGSQRSREGVALCWRPWYLAAVGCLLLSATASMSFSTVHAAWHCTSCAGCGFQQLFWCRGCRLQVCRASRSGPLSVQRLLGRMCCAESSLRLQLSCRGSVHGSLQSAKCCHSCLHLPLMAAQTAVGVQG